MGFTRQQCPDTHTHTHLHLSTKHQKIYEMFLEAGTKKAAESESNTTRSLREEKMEKMEEWRNERHRRREDKDRSLNVEKKNILQVRLQSPHGRLINHRTSCETSWDETSAGTTFKRIYLALILYSIKAFKSLNMMDEYDTTGQQQRSHRDLMKCE